MYLNYNMRQGYTEEERYQFNRQYLDFLMSEDNKDRYYQIRLMNGITEVYNTSAEEFANLTGFRVSKHLFKLIVKYKVDKDPDGEYFFSGSASIISSRGDVSEQTPKWKNKQYKFADVEDILRNPTAFK